MKEAFELIIERLKLPQGVAKRCLDFKVAKAYGNTIEIVNEVAEKFAPDINVSANMPEKLIGSDDFCEWTSTGISDNWKPSCEPNSTYNVFGVAWFRRCPYCGKKIKVVE